MGGGGKVWSNFVIFQLSAVIFHTQTQFFCFSRSQLSKLCLCLQEWLPTQWNFFSYKKVSWRALKIYLGKEPWFITGELVHQLSALFSNPTNPAALVGILFPFHAAPWGRCTSPRVSLQLRSPNAFVKEQLHQTVTVWPQCQEAWRWWCSSRKLGNRRAWIPTALWCVHSIVYMHCGGRTLTIYLESHNK